MNLATEDVGRLVDFLRRQACETLRICDELEGGVSDDLWTGFKVEPQPVVGSVSSVVDSGGEPPPDNLEFVWFDDVGRQVHKGPHYVPKIDVVGSCLHVHVHVKPEKRIPGSRLAQRDVVLHSSIVLPDYRISDAALKFVAAAHRGKSADFSVKVHRGAAALPAAATLVFTEAKLKFKVGESKDANWKAEWSTNLTVTSDLENDCAFHLDVENDNFRQKRNVTLLAESPVYRDVIVLLARTFSNVHTCKALVNVTNVAMKDAQNFFGRVLRVHVDVRAPPPPSKVGGGNTIVKAPPLMAVDKQTPSLGDILQDLANSGRLSKHACAHVLGQLPL